MAYRNPDYHKEYYVRNRERLLEQMAARRAENYEAHLAQRRVYYAEHREKILTRQAVYHAKNRKRRSSEAAARYAANKDQILAQQAARYAKKQENIAGRPKPDRCEVCSRLPTSKGLVFDHCHVLLSFRGWLCVRCNTALGNVNDDPKILDALAAYLRRWE